MKYRRKPNPIEAHQVTDLNPETWPEWARSPRWFGTEALFVGDYLERLAQNGVQRWPRLAFEDTYESILEIGDVAEVWRRFEKETLPILNGQKNPTVPYSHPHGHGHRSEE